MSVNTGRGREGRRRPSPLPDLRRCTKDKGPEGREGPSTEPPRSRRSMGALWSAPPRGGLPADAFRQDTATQRDRALRSATGG
ncbi:hypothetical protein GCM10017559_42650 [Streptosporangium longisporum]|uniref:Uncharacterized protein n=1 Tax=Streptosporangium longisporum TaxID=46187 RepID=A0ABP6KJV6_9ACTN